MRSAVQRHVFLYSLFIISYISLLRVGRTLRKNVSSPEQVWSNLKDLLSARHARCKDNIYPDMRFRIYSTSPFREDQRVNVHMDKKYGPAQGLITPRQRLSLSTMSKDKDSGLLFPVLPGYTKFLSLKCDMVEKPETVSSCTLRAEQL